METETMPISQLPIGCFFVEATVEKQRHDGPVFHKNVQGVFSSTTCGGDSFVGIGADYFAQKLFTIVSKPNWIG